jgi:hypothetical protein
MLLKPMTLQTPLLKKLTNQTGATISLALATSSVFLGVDVGLSPRSIALLSDEVVRASERKDDVVTSSMYACVREAVVLRRGVRRMKVRRVGVRVKPKTVGWVIFWKGGL